MRLPGGIELIVPIVPLANFGSLAGERMLRQAMRVNGEVATKQGHWDGSTKVEPAAAFSICVTQGSQSEASMFAT